LEGGKTWDICSKTTNQRIDPKNRNLVQERKWGGGDPRDNATFLPGLPPAKRERGGLGRQQGGEGGTLRKKKGDFDKEMGIGHGGGLFV